MPIFGAALAIGLLGERPSPYHAAGAGLVGLGIALASYRQRASKDRTAV